MQQKNRQSLIDTIAIQTIDAIGTHLKDESTQLQLAKMHAALKSNDLDIILEFAQQYRIHKKINAQGNILCLKISIFLYDAHVIYVKAGNKLEEKISQALVNDLPCPLNIPLDTWFPIHTGIYIHSIAKTIEN